MREWGAAQRRKLVRWLERWAVYAEGSIVQAEAGAISDGVDYSLPVIIPEWVAPEQRAEFVKAALREASAAFHFQFDRPYTLTDNLSLFPVADPLREWDYITRRAVLSRCHTAHERNPLANTAVAMTTFFSVGDGMTLTYRNQDHVARVLEEFRNQPDNAVQEYEKSLCNDLQIDGELFIQFHEQDGRIVITPLPPWEIDWIETERGFLRRPVNYHRSGGQSNGVPGDFEAINTDIPAEQVLHVAVNRASYELRGRPELFRILPWLKAYKDWLENRARQNVWRGGLLWDVTLTGGTPTQVAAKRAQYKQPPAPGSLAIHNDKEQWQALENKSNAADVSEDGRQMKLMNAVGAQLPEYMLSDGQNANLASATAQQLPALRKFSNFQDILTYQVWMPIYRRVLERAIEAGLLPAQVEEQDEDGEAILDDDGQPQWIDALDAFDVSAPELESDDPKDLAEALKIATGYEWASNETASARMGFDYRLEQKKIKREKAANIEAAMQGQAFGPLPPQQTPPPNGAQPEEYAESLSMLRAAVPLTEAGEAVTPLVVRAPAVNVQPIADALRSALDEMTARIAQAVENAIDRIPPPVIPELDTSPIAAAVEQGLARIPAPRIPPVDTRPIADAIRAQPAPNVTATVILPPVVERIEIEKSGEGRYTATKEISPKE